MISRFLSIKRFHRTNPTTIQWNKTLRSHQTNGKHDQALKLFELGIDKKSFQPNSVTFLTMIEVCRDMKCLKSLKFIERLINQSKNDPSDHEEIYQNSRVRSLLMDGFIKCDDLQSAQRVFQSMEQRNNVDYAALMTALNQHGHFDKTWQIGKELSSKFIKSSTIVSTLIIQACAELDRYDEIVKLHRLIEDSLDKDKILFNSLISFYLKFNDEKSAWKIFEKFSSQKTVVEFSLFMKYYVRQHQPEKCLDLFQSMIKNNRVSMDHIPLVLCAQAIANGLCQYSVEPFLEYVHNSPKHMDVENSLINMYGK